MKWWMGFATSTRQRLWKARLRVVALATIATGAAAEVATLDYGNIGSLQTPTSYGQCGRTLSAEAAGSATNLRLTPNAGVGIGGSPLMTDGSTLIVTFNASVDLISYTLNAAQDTNSNGTPGETLLRAFNDSGALLGTATVSGAGPIDATAALGVGRIRELEISPQGDAIRVRTISHELPSLQLVGMSYEKVGNTGGFSFTECGVQILPPSGGSLTIGSGTGVGVLTNVSPNAFVVDPGEFVQIEFPEGPLDTDVKLRSGVSGVVTVTALDVDLVAIRSLDFNYIGGNTWEDLSDLFMNPPELAGFRLQPKTGFLQITGVRREVVPEASATVSGMVCAGVLLLCRRLRRSAA